MFETQGNLLTISPYKIIKTLHTSNIEWHKINIPIPKVKESEHGKEWSKSDQSSTGKTSGPAAPFPESGHMMKLVVLHPSRYATCSTRNFSAGLIPLHAHRHPGWVSYSHDLSGVLGSALEPGLPSQLDPVASQGLLTGDSDPRRHLLVSVTLGNYGTKYQDTFSPASFMTLKPCHVDDFSKYYSQLKMKPGSLGLKLCQLKHSNPWKHSSR